MRELTVRWEVREGPLEGQVVTTGSQVAQYCADLHGESVEVVRVVLLTSRHSILGHRDIGRAGVDSCPVVPAEVFRAALLGGAAAVVLVHCHPSGKPQPSPQDEKVTKRLEAIGDELGLPVVDHIVMAAGGHRGWVSAAFGTAGPE